MQFRIRKIESNFSVLPRWWEMCIMWLPRATRLAELWIWKVNLCLKKEYREEEIYQRKIWDEFIGLKEIHVSNLDYRERNVNVQLNIMEERGSQHCETVGSLRETVDYVLKRMIDSLV